MICGKKIERIRSLLLQNYDIFFNFIVNVRLFDFTFFCISLFYRKSAEFIPIRQNDIMKQSLARSNLQVCFKPLPNSL